MDLLVSSDANLLVVVESTSDAVVGVVTVSDVLEFITNTHVSGAYPYKWGSPMSVGLTHVSGAHPCQWGSPM